MIIETFNEICKKCGKITEHKIGKFSFSESVDDWKNVIEDVTAFTHTSSFVGQVIYDYEAQDMAAILSDRSYVWCEVPARVFDGWEGADSKGAYFNRIIKGQYDC